MKQTTPILEKRGTQFSMRKILPPKAICNKCGSTDCEITEVILENKVKEEEIWHQ